MLNQKFMSMMIMILMLMSIVLAAVSRCWKRVLLRLNLVRISSETSYQTSDAFLELAVLGGVDERVDTYTGTCAQGT